MCSDGFFSDGQAETYCLFIYFYSHISLAKLAKLLLQDELPYEL